MLKSMHFWSTAKAILSFGPLALLRQCDWALFDCGHGASRPSITQGPSKGLSGPP